MAPNLSFDAHLKSPSIALLVQRTLTPGLHYGFVVEVVLVHAFKPQFRSIEQGVSRDLAFPSLLHSITPVLLL